MTQRIVIPTEDKSGLDAHLAEHLKSTLLHSCRFGRQQPEFNVRTEINKGKHVGGTGHPHEHLLALKPKIFVVQGMEVDA